MIFMDAWQVLVLFLIPIGGGIPAGVLLARSRGFDWPVMMALYFLSDVILACLFEPILKLLIAVGRRVELLTRLIEALKGSVQRSAARYGNSTGWLALVMISFGVDPMTGRAAAVAAGHGFLSGWLIAIAGDMMYFTVLMVSTLWLSSVLGDGTWAMVIIFALMMGVPALIRRFRKRPEAEKRNPAPDSIQGRRDRFGS